MYKLRLILIAGIIILAGSIFIIFRREADEHKEIKNLVNNAIKVLYIGNKKYELGEIFTNEYATKFAKNPESNENEKSRLYTVDKGFMKSFRKINNNTADVTVYLHEKEGHHRILIFSITKTAEGKWLVSNIEVDI